MYGISASCAVPASSVPLYLIIVEFQNLLVHVFAMQCHKCSHYQGLDSIGDCKSCGKREWYVSPFRERGPDEQIVFGDKDTTLDPLRDQPLGLKTAICQNCDKPTEVFCVRCGEEIIDGWLEMEEPAPPEPPMTLAVVVGRAIGIILYVFIAYYIIDYFF